MKRKYSRREFVKLNSAIGLGGLIPHGLNSSIYGRQYSDKDQSSKIGNITNEVILYGRKNNQAWFEPAVGVIPGHEKKLPQVFVRVTLLTGNDIGPQLFLKTDDLGKTWSNPVLCQNWFKVPMEETGIA